MAWYRAGGGGIPSSLKTGMNSVLNKKFGTSTTYDPAGWPDDVNLLGKLPEKTASGALVNIADGADEVPLKDLIFSASPIQAAGTPSPSNPLPISGHAEMNGYHAGKNLFDISSLNVSPVSVSDGVATGTGHNFYATFRNGIPNILVPKTQFTISAKAYTTGTSGTTGDGLFFRIFYTDGTNDTLYFLNSDSSYTTRSLTSDANKTASAIGISCASNGWNTWWLKEVQIEISNQATTYSAYTAETHKWTFPPFGKNLFDKNAIENDKYLDTTTGLPVTATNYVVSNYIAVKKDIPIYIPNTWTERRWFYDVNKTPKTYLNTSSAQLYTPTEDGYIRVSILKTQVDIDTFQIELSGVSSYEPYQSMFAGSVNALTGEAKSLYALYKVTSFEGIWNVSNPNGTAVYATIPKAKHVVEEDPNMRSNILTFSTKSRTTLPLYAYNAFDGTNTTYTFCLPSSVTSLAEANQWLENQTDGLYIIIKLADPIEIDMDSVDWQTQLGDNNFFNDCGDTSVTYRADIDLALGGN